MTISIWGRYKNNAPEKLDSASSEPEAMRLLGEYQMAFGKDWQVWKGRRDQGPQLGGRPNTLAARQEYNEIGIPAARMTRDWMSKKR